MMTYVEVVLSVYQCNAGDVLCSESVYHTEIFDSFCSILFFSLGGPENRGVLSAKSVVIWCVFYITVFPFPFKFVPFLREVGQLVERQVSVAPFLFLIS
jgi:hypothetical protein